MKVKPSVKPICEKCKVIKRKGRVMVICAASGLKVRGIARGNRTQNAWGPSA